MAEARFQVRGIGDADSAFKVEAMLHSKVGVHEVRADPETGELWIRYDERLVPPPRLKTYLESAGVRPVRPL
jgi:hypothetical protein